MKYILLFLISLGLTTQVCVGNNFEPKPNFVFILADDVNKDTWGVYGGKDCKTPHIDRLAKEGMTFNNAYCAVAMCAPFRQELYSGKNPWRTGTLANHSKSKKGTKSICHYMAPLGYRVALTGKGHIGPSEVYPFEHLETKKELAVQEARAKGANKRELRKLFQDVDENEQFISVAESFIEECTAQNKYFCLYIASNDGHAPYTTGDASQYNPDDLTIPPYWIDTPETRKGLPAYYAEITNFDRLVGMARTMLEEKGLWENTILVVCSEQGAAKPFAKWTCYNDGLGSGLVMTWPGVIKPGSVCDELISIADITPTFVDIAGGELQVGECDGKSFKKTLKGEKQVLHDYILGAFTNCNINGSKERIYPVRVIRNKEFTLIWNPNHNELTNNAMLKFSWRRLHEPDWEPHPKYMGLVSWYKKENKTDLEESLVVKLHRRPEYELYDLKKDPHELYNQINNPEYEKVAKKLKEQLHAGLEELNDSNPIQTEKALVNHSEDH